MEFRPCIDIHNGRVKQIVGSSLSDKGNFARNNFISNQDASYYADIYKKYSLHGGHIILLNSKDSEYYEDTKKQALDALAAYPGGMQIGGGITDENALEYLKAGASHVIVTSYFFNNGELNRDKLKLMKDKVGSDRVVIDLSCRKKDNKYIIMTNRWQTYSNEVLNYELLDYLSDYCDEFLIHAVDVEGKSQGIEEELIKYLAIWNKKTITYAGGIRNISDMQLIYDIGNQNINATIGSALELFGGSIKIEEIVRTF